MLNIILYGNVPFQSDYANIIQFANKTAVETYLSNFEIGRIENIEMFWQNGDSISLETIYETANYMMIEDSNAVIQKKFYFIESITLDSSSCGVYNLVCDIWHTYSYDIEFKPSLCVSGHAELIAPNASYYMSDYTPKFEYNLNTTNSSAGNKLIDDISDVNGKACAIAIITIENYGTTIAFSHDAYYDETEQRYYTYRDMIFQFLQALMRNTIIFHDMEHATYTAYTFKIEKVYYINDFSMHEYLESMREQTSQAAYLNVPYEEVYLPILGQRVPPYEDSWKAYIYKPLYYAIDSIDDSEYLKRMSMLQIQIKSMPAFDTTKLKANAKYMLGTLTNSIEINAAKNGNFNMYLMLYIAQSNQISIYLEASNKAINITNEFEIPFVNDEYNLYMSTNQATIDAANKTASIQLASSMAMSAIALATASISGGASLALLGGAVGAGAGFLQNRIKQNAMLEDAKKILAKNDGIYGAGALTAYNGVGVFEYVSTDSYANDYFNNYGNAFNAIIDNYKFTDNNYNFYYIKFGEVNMTGNFNNGIKKQLESILLHGVRFWIDSSRFLDDISYKKS